MLQIDGLKQTDGTTVMGLRNEPYYLVLGRSIDMCHSQV
jgi:hypothetical protein